MAPITGAISEGYPLLLTGQGILKSHHTIILWWLDAECVYRRSRQLSDGGVSAAPVLTGIVAVCEPILAVSVPITVPCGMVVPVGRCAFKDSV